MQHNNIINYIKITLKEVIITQIPMDMRALRRSFSNM